MIKAPQSHEDAAPPSVDPRLLAAWREWLGALATDAEAAIAAAHVYGELAPEARDAWLDALTEDGPVLSVPKVAIYAPLLSVEGDPARRERIEQAIGADFDGAPGGEEIRVLSGVAADGSRIAALVSPLYLSFVRVLWCRYAPDWGFHWVRHDPILASKNAPHAGVSVDGLRLEPVPLSPAIEELALAVLAQRRRGAELPPSLRLFAHLFDPHLEGSAP
ncbi:MAG: hypothetical protein U0359_13830 [Byssovorax sp.]